MSDERKYFPSTEYEIRKRKIETMFDLSFYVKPHTITFIFSDYGVGTTVENGPHKLK